MTIVENVLNKIKVEIDCIISITPNGDWNFTIGSREFSFLCLTGKGPNNYADIHKLIEWSNSLNRDDTQYIVHTLHDMCTDIMKSFEEKPIELNDFRVKVLIELMKMQIDYLR